MKIKFYRIICLLLTSTSVAWGQQQDSVDYHDLTLEELMNIEIVSASKKSESLFDASLSASVITREEIRNAGATSIMEALRLVPGVIVREQTNGNYDIHVRGLDNVPPNSLTLSSTNTTTLVMINNRPVYNYLQGGTFWETLPIDLNDVERIEVVRGPSSTLYGPNAVSGVINIITREAGKDGLNVNGSAQMGSLNTSIVNASGMYRFNDKFNLGVSGNYQHRDRSETRYMDYATNQWVNTPNELSTSNPTERYPHPERSMAKYGLNSFLQYTPSERVKLNLAGGWQDSQVQSIMFDNSVSNLSTTSTNSRYADLRATTYGVTTQLSYTNATQAPAQGLGGSRYEYSVIDANIEYEFVVNKLSIKPGITYRDAVYDDSKYWDIANYKGSINGKESMETLGAGVRLDYLLLNEKLRLAGGIRFDKFTYPDKVFTSYQAAASYKLNDANLIRVVYSKAYRSPFIFDTFIDYRSIRPTATPGVSTVSIVSGNKDLALLNSGMIELGFRSKLRSNISLDIEGYYTRTKNYTAIIQGATQLTPANYPIVAQTDIKVGNLPFEVAQLGTSISLNVVIDKLQLKPFITLQKTTLEDYAPYFSTSAAAPNSLNNFDPATYNLNSGIGTETEHQFTPKAYGGAFINYSISQKFNINVNTYWFSKQTFLHRQNIEFKDGVRGIEHIEGKAIVNARVSYVPVKAVSIFVTGKNLLGKKSIEYFDGDATPSMVLGGVTFDF
ncbi:TonB-dependent receptor plug domain-containing protein [Fulvivirgaceae bacterium PWU4]|uniref:TonB-dependent receptor plug domain-containing protein n=1 Tax=Chryseosolibacter histidini TaxID=2782349 RepID=A0AAP2DK55_9BACT|nr:TonB-dependent receptor [Chryseosolibacter histidini]MBT1697863.1 TonB-dependent receptor plug domain-containing protein [Chryseosolibacter histidini]